MENKVAEFTLNDIKMYNKATVTQTAWYLCKGRQTVAPHSSTLAWKIPWTEEPGGLQSMGSLGVGHD